MKIVFFTFYYPPDLSAGAFRAVALAQALSIKLNDNDELHIITTHPNRYKSHLVEANNIDVIGNTTIHRIKLPGQKKRGIFLQAYSFFFYAVAGYKLCIKLNPIFLIGTSGRLMTGILTGITAFRLRCKYFIDLRDIFSETISGLLLNKNRVASRLFLYFFSFLEKHLLKNASGINVVSEGFPEYFQNKGIDTSHWSFFPNGVDKEFIGIPSTKNLNTDGIKTILYAGNIGGGQGLEKILPEAAKQLEGSFHFQLIGDGNSQANLINQITLKNVRNIEIIQPIERIKLIEYYKNADILFLHLNDIPAFHRVLPSKIFEYAAFNKPIVAGLSGYSEKFMYENIPYSILFKPGDVKGLIKSILKADKLNLRGGDNNDFFIEKYKREHIMQNMAQHVLSKI